MIKLTEENIKFTELDGLIEKFEEDGYIDCAWDDLNEEKEFETIIEYLKENKSLKEGITKLRDKRPEIWLKNALGELINIKNLEYAKNTP